MSTPKTPDNAMTPEPIGSPPPGLKGQDAKWRKSRKRIARALLRKLNEDNCERYGVSKAQIASMREAAYGAR